MMDTQAKSTVLTELESIEKVCMRWAVTESNAIEPKAMALMLADFYTGIEAVCIRVIEATEGPIDRSEEGWSADLLETLALDVDGKRPALITPALKRHLRQFHNLREYLRETPGSTPASDMLRVLLCSMEATLTQFRSCVLRFLERIA